MAPEMVLGDTEFGFEADWWAVGLIAYELMFGSHPFANHRNKKKQNQAIVIEELRLPE